MGLFARPVPAREVKHLADLAVISICEDLLIEKIMAELQLQVPACPAGSHGTKKLKHKELHQRIEALPAFDVAARIMGLGQLLVEINGVSLAVKTRQSLVDRISAEVQDILLAYQKEVRHVSFPVSAGFYSLYSELQHLLNEFATAYKLLILDLLPEHAGKSDKVALSRAIQQCIEYLSQQALQAYAIYQDAPVSIWQDLHRLYAYAEKHNMSTVTVDHGPELSIGAAYGRIVLLATANPYHLMHGEVYQAYAKLKGWMPAVSFEHPRELSAQAMQELLIDRHFCDLAGDSPPCYGMKGITDSAEDPRLIKLDELLAVITNRMKLLALNCRRSLQLRSEWDLLCRLRDAWEKRQLRCEPRSLERGNVRAIVGLSACHHYFSGYKLFAPEDAEMSLHGEDVSNTKTLGLVPAEDTPWLDEEVINKLHAGEIKPRAYRFDVEHVETDIWKKANMSGPRWDTTLEKKVEESTLKRIFEFNHIDNSVGGDGLQSFPGSQVQLRVGDLVAAFPQGDVHDSEPVLHVVRWMHSDSEQNLCIGVRRSPGEVTPVAVRALSEEVQFKAYAKAFVLQSDEDRTSLILPAGLYESGNAVLLNDGDTLQILRLESLMENTRAFVRFTFKQFDVDDQLSEEIVASLKRLLRNEIK